jgi:hypothetical protein
VKKRNATSERGINMHIFTRLTFLVSNYAVSATEVVAQNIC